MNSLAQIVLVHRPRCAGLYQGTEIWDFSLVDPDSRSGWHPARQHLLDSVFAANPKGY
jgi:maltooligosyltrehalose synthase